MRYSVTLFTPNHLERLSNDDWMNLESFGFPVDQYAERETAFVSAVKGPTVEAPDASSEVEIPSAVKIEEIPVNSQETLTVQAVEVHVAFSWELRPIEDREAGQSSFRSIRIPEWSSATTKRIRESIFAIDFGVLCPFDSGFQCRNGFAKR